jgi:hypothetical protein
VCFHKFQHFLVAGDALLCPEAGAFQGGCGGGKAAGTFLKAFIFVSLSLQLIFTDDKTFA